MNKNELNAQELVAVIEGLLFLSGTKGMTYEELATYLSLKPKKAQILSAISTLTSKYDNDNSCGLSLIKVGTVYKLTTKKIHAPIYEKIKPAATMRLSAAAIETLAIISYNNPITKSQIAAIRGVNCDNVIARLKSLALVTAFVRSDLPGKPNVYTITDKFMDYFQIESLSQLPKLTNFTANTNNNQQEIYDYEK